MSISTNADLLHTPHDHAYDHGLSHDHHWAKDRTHCGRRFPIVANAAHVTTPSSARHDDIHYAAT